MHFLKIAAWVVSAFSCINGNSGGLPFTFSNVKETGEIIESSIVSAMRPGSHQVSWLNGFHYSCLSKSSSHSPGGKQHQLRNRSRERKSQPSNAGDESKVAKEEEEEGRVLDNLKAAAISKHQLKKTRKKVSARLVTLFS